VLLFLRIILFFLALFLVSTIIIIYNSIILFLFFIIGLSLRFLLLDNESADDRGLTAEGLSHQLLVVFGLFGTKGVRWWLLDVHYFQVLQLLPQIIVNNICRHYK
jgi:hypothetical protein